MDPSSGFDQLYLAARSLDRAAQDGLVRRYWVELGEFVERIVGPGVRKREEPEDLRISALETFLRRLPSFPDDLTEPELKARLFQIAKWRVGDVLKKDSRETRVGSWGGMDREASLPSRGAVTMADDLRRLREVIEQMKPDYAEVLRCSVLEGKDLQATANELGITEENARKRLQRAKQQLLALTERWRGQEKRG